MTDFGGGQELFRLRVAPSKIAGGALLGYDP
jgi:hypothetical protein